MGTFAHADGVATLALRCAHAEVRPQQRNSEVGRGSDQSFAAPRARAPGRRHTMYWTTPKRPPHTGPPTKYRVLG